MRIHTTKSGFTLVETLISTIIAVIILGAATGIGRSVNNSVEVAQEQAEMNSIADRIMTSFQLYEENGQNVSGNTGLYNIIINPYTTAGSTAYGEFYDGYGKIPNSMTLLWEPYFNYPTGVLTYAGYPNTLQRWNSGSDSFSFYNPVKVNGVDDNTVFTPPGSSGSSLENSSPFTFNGSPIPVTSLISVCTHPEISSTYPLTSCLNSDGTTNNSFASSSNQILLRSAIDGPVYNDNQPDINDPSWTTFEVSTSLQAETSAPIFRLSKPYLTFILYSQSGGLIAQPKVAALDRESYVATVHIANFHNPKYQVTRTMLLTDWII